MAASFEYPAHGDRLTFVGLFQGGVSFNDPNFHRREPTLLASRNALPGDFTRVIKLIEASRIDTTPWITHRRAFASATEHFSSWFKTRDRRYQSSDRTLNSPPPSKRIVPKAGTINDAAAFRQALTPNSLTIPQLRVAGL